LLHKDRCTRSQKINKWVDEEIRCGYEGLKSHLYGLQGFREAVVEHVYKAHCTTPPHQLVVGFEEGVDALLNLEHGLN